MLNTTGTQVKNLIEVWGKDGLCYGEARDENAISPFNVNSIGELRAVYSGDIYDNIYDRYKHPDRVADYLKEQAKHETEIAKLKALKPESDDEKADINRRIAQETHQLNLVKSQIRADIYIYGKDMAKDYADKLLYENCRINDSLNIQTIFMPFINDVDFQVTHRTKLDNSVNPYIIKSVSHDLANNTSTINAMRFYKDISAANWIQLPAPHISTYYVDEMTLTVNATTVSNATSYVLYVDSDIAVISNSPIISYTIPDKFEGVHSFYVTARATGYLESVYDETYTATFEAGKPILVNKGKDIALTTEANERILYEK